MGTCQDIRNQFPYVFLQKKTILVRKNLEKMFKENKRTYNKYCLDDITEIIRKKKIGQKLETFKNL